MYFHVIMPLGSDPSASDKRRSIERIAQEHQLVVHFPRYAPDSSIFDLDATMEELKRADFVIADLSLERPSCYYELGLAEALRKPVHLIAWSGTDIHQTANRAKVSWFGNLTEFEAVVGAILSHEAQPGPEANKPLQPTAYSIRSCVAPASGSG